MGMGGEEQRRGRKGEAQEKVMPRRNKVWNLSQAGRMKNHSHKSGRWTTRESLEFYTFQEVCRF